MLIAEFIYYWEIYLPMFPIKAFDWELIKRYKKWESYPIKYVYHWMKSCHSTTNITSFWCFVLYKFYLLFFPSLYHTSIRKSFYPFEFFVDFFICSDCGYCFGWYRNCNFESNYDNSSSPWAQRFTFSYCLNRSLLVDS